MASSSPSPRPPPLPPPTAPSSRCTLVADNFGVLVQAGLAISAVGTLVYKRQTERPRRPWLVWAFDASKQVFAGLLQHVVNLSFGVILAEDGGASECAWYFVNFTISVICGMFILAAVMRAYRRLVTRYQLKLLVSGEYGTPPDWRPWLAQLLIWGFISAAEKFFTAFTVILPLHEPLDSLASWLEGPFASSPNVELLVVMVVNPVLLNVVFFWVIDSIVMRDQHAAASEEVTLSMGGWPLSTSALEDRLTGPALQLTGSGSEPSAGGTGPQYLRSPLVCGSDSLQPQSPLMAGAANSPIRLRERVSLREQVSPAAESYAPRFDAVVVPHASPRPPVVSLSPQREL